MRVPQEDRHPASPSSATTTADISLVCIRNIGRIKPNSMTCVGFEKLPDVSSQDGPNQDVGVYDDHLNEGKPSHDDASA